MHVFLQETSLQETRTKMPKDLENSSAENYSKYAVETLFLSNTNNH